MSNKIADQAYTHVHGHTEYYVIIVGKPMCVCDDYIALKLKFPVDIIDLVYWSSMHVSLLMSLQEQPPGGGQVSTDEQQIWRE